jgi:hypothetical protein
MNEMIEEEEYGMRRRGDWGERGRRGMKEKERGGI